MLAVIPARGGSKGIPRKNIRPLAGRPLIEWTIMAGRDSGLIDRLILSSDDQEIAGIAAEAGCEIPFLRPPELARDDTPTISTVLHLLDALEDKYDYVVVLQPTSPLRTAEDIDACITRCHETGAPGCVSISVTGKHPMWTFDLDGEGRIRPLFDSIPDRRQDLPTAYTPNGAVYVARTDQLARHGTFYMPDTQGHVMPHERSWDIDHEIDFLICNLLMEQAMRTENA
ncbi:acylneuraminate cytidylyltransferase family protein [Thiohalobacter sp. IOR34]|uniref:acylneuraminate cytidylyltransferase family protein n=1 Tax=Thiohalobacter sp. IOR34 TaxID=3057176 RepID=UPI0025B080BD|nr:acylneuraminate cytidylyltransferase family protein [Thiohalobacter sp. IOR34]WJW76841.1 acylneuraminate cytidylyltransferase family protein [Thiohalobacter sp. IOR34]